MWKLQDPDLHVAKNLKKQIQQYDLQCKNTLMNFLWVFVIYIYFFVFATWRQEVFCLQVVNFMSYIHRPTWSCQFLLGWRDVLLMLFNTFLQIIYSVLLFATHLGEVTEISIQDCARVFQIWTPAIPKGFTFAVQF